jgi:hypothetical protein
MSLSERRTSRPGSRAEVRSYEREQRPRRRPWDARASPAVHGVIGLPSQAGISASRATFRMSSSSRIARFSAEDSTVFMTWTTAHNCLPFNFTGTPLPPPGPVARVIPVIVAFLQHSASAAGIELLVVRGRVFWMRRR